MPAITQDEVIDQLRNVQDPELHRDIVSLDMVKGVDINGGAIRVKVELTTPACPRKDEIGRDVEAAVRSLPGVEAVEIEWSANVRPRGANGGAVGPDGKPLEAIPGVKHIIAVGAGKGGVGKSTVSVLLAVGMRRAGARVGLMDADVYGPSIPTMMGIEGSKPSVEDGKMVPIEAAGVPVMSIGFMVERDKPLIWRGPIVHGVVKQFLDQVLWGELDYLIVDLPPGTGDVPLTLAQSIPMTGAVIVCTPQEVALIDARRAVRMFQQLNVGCLGIIENMSYYLCPKCGNRDELFDHGGAAAAARELDVPFLGEIPLNVAVRISGDAGTPERVFTDTPDYVSEAIHKVVGNVAGQVSVAAFSGASAPTLTVE